MAVLGESSKRLFIGNASKDAENATQHRYITDEEIVTTSSKLVYFRWLSRLVVLCAVISLSFFLSSSLVVFRLAPEILVEPLLIINQNNSDEVVRYEPMNTKMSSLKQLTEMFVKQYVIMRNTVINDEMEMRTRWGPGGIVAYMSAPDVYREFVGENAAKIENMFDNDYSSEVRIDKIGRIGENSPVWIVNFTTFNLSRNQEGGGSLVLKESKYRASITPRFLDFRGFVSPRLINPMGFTVMKYSQDKIRD